MLELVTVFILNGLFALSGLAIVSARKARLKMMTDNGPAGASTALKLAEDPGRFLSMVQIGIAVAGVLTGAFSGAALGAVLTGILKALGVPDEAAEPLGYGLVIGSITCLSVGVGGLVPKCLALRNPEGVACAVAPLMALISRIAAPAVWFLDASPKPIFRLAGQSTEFGTAVTEKQPEAMQRADGSGLLADEMADKVGIALSERRDYETVAAPPDRHIAAHAGNGRSG
ncbi:CNNM domain-containing protein [Microvirga makkahensis]|uniref:CNNM domain-containing protein n=1 Tax=Microvirga makkahensis TaxID=1128670 RepID=UPI0031B5D3DC